MRIVRGQYFGHLWLHSGEYQKFFGDGRKFLTIAGRGRSEVTQQLGKIPLCEFHFLTRLVRDTAGVAVFLFIGFYMGSIAQPVHAAFLVIPRQAAAERFEFRELLGILWTFPASGLPFADLGPPPILEFSLQRAPVDARVVLLRRELRLRHGAVPKIEPLY
jgi:hypothetical protein